MTDTSKYLALFVSEATAHAQDLGRQLPILERPSFEPSLIDELHRHAHSLRGMSAAMGFDEITELARGVEDLLARMQGSQHALAPKATEALGEADARLLEMIRARAGGSTLSADPRLIAALVAA